MSTGAMDNIPERLSGAMAAVGVRVHYLGPVAPSLEDIFISTLRGVAHGPGLCALAEGLTKKRFGDFTAVEDVSFSACQ